jgi:thiamine-phosphate pyrophosphorylase
MTNVHRRFGLPRLYAITDTKLSGLSHSVQVEALCSGGAKLIQLREESLGADEFYTEAKRALEVGRRYDARILINDRVDIALAVAADGVHLGQTDLPPEAARRVLGDKMIIGFSTHNLQQAKNAAKLPIDYLAVGPIFPTSTKTDTADVVGLAGLSEVRAAIQKIPLVAIGGIRPNRAQAVFDAGADSVAVVSFLISDPMNIEVRTREFLLLTRAHAH